MSPVGKNEISTVSFPEFCTTETILSDDRNVLNSKLIPTFCLNKFLPVPILEPVFASPPEAPGAAAGLNFVPSQVKTSLTLGASAPAVLTSVKASIDFVPSLVSTSESE